MQDWKPNISFETARQRANFLAKARDFFVKRDILEVETPILANHAVTDIHLHSFQVHDSQQRTIGFLQTSPEFFMKRLLAAGFGSMYQLSTVFRAEEKGSQHLREFKLLEWYRLGFDLEAMMAETVQFAAAILGARPIELLSYQQVFEQSIGINPHLATREQLQKITQQHIDVNLDPSDDESMLLDLLFSHCIQTTLGHKKFTVVYHFPKAQAALAKLKIDTQGHTVAERFELFIDGVEIANGYHELTEFDEQRRRFETDNQQRQQRGLPKIAIDHAFLAALEHGLPDCSGVALGWDRLLMIALEEKVIDRVVCFSSSELKN